MYYLRFLNLINVEFYPHSNTVKYIVEEEMNTELERLLFPFTSNRSFDKVVLFTLKINGHIL